MKKLRFILPDQISHFISSLNDINPKTDVVMLCELFEEATYVKHHKKKLAFLFAAMQHFAEELKAKGTKVRYVTLDNPENTGTIEKEINRALNDLKLDLIIVTEPSEYRVLEKFKSLQKTLNTPIDIRKDDRFLATHEWFSNWAGNKKQLRMEFFYREMRKKYNILIEPNGEPTGGKWNYDKENRKPPTKDLKSPKRISHKKSKITKEVLSLVNKTFADHFGVLEPFHYALTHDQAMIELNHFIDFLLPKFGDYQDAMVAGEPYLYHSLLSSYLNAGLLLPLEICKIAEKAYRQNKAPLNAVEGFIRQILGWREYIRCIYWHYMPEYGQLNSLNAKRKLPDFYWTADTKMFCVGEAVRHTRDYAYSHHIQRLMITGNFALLAGLDVKEVQEWYLAVYSDAYEWVEMPNTLGMTLFGDGGIVASKPYAASGKYINRMSNYCKNCIYDPEILLGEKACPFNSLYWDFIRRHKKAFKSNPRMSYILKALNNFGSKKEGDISYKAAEILEKMSQGKL